MTFCTFQKLIRVLKLAIKIYQDINSYLIVKAAQKFDI